MDTRLDAIDTRLDAIDTRLGNLERLVEAIHKRVA
jgi:hypothetical protein